jgi:hypothetical protein
MMLLNEDQLSKAIQEDMEKREQFGLKKYSQYVKAGDNRDFLQEAYEELLDLAVYLKADLLQTEHKLEVESVWQEVIKDIPLEYNRKLLGGVELVYFKTIENIYNLRAIMECRRVKKQQESKEK